MRSQLEAQLETYWKKLFPFDEVAEFLGLRRKPVDIGIVFGSADEYRWRHVRNISSAEELRDAVVSHQPIPVALNAIPPYPVLDIDVSGASARVLLTYATLLTISLDEEFGFSQLRWFFSGRRGLHCWIREELAREWMENSEVRRDFAQTVASSCSSGAFSFLVNGMGMTEKEAIETCSRLPIDTAVISQYRHMIRLPFSPHQGTRERMLCWPLRKGGDHGLFRLEKVPLEQALTDPEMFDAAVKEAFARAP